jgi:hypothetical protein
LTGNLPGVARAGDDLLDDLVVPGGSGMQEDRAAAIVGARLLPATVAGFLLRKNSQIIVCRESVTDFAIELKGVRPRGWPEGKTWDSVPGCFDTKRKKVLVATRAAATGERVLPPTGHGHGSVDLLLHESMHGHDFLKGHRILKSDDFERAYLADFAELGSYEQQPGDAGRQETYAESAARVFGDDLSVQGQWPALTGFWQAIDAAELEVAGVEDMPRLALELDAVRPIGTAELAADGTLNIDLRAEDDAGMIGHATFIIPRDSPAFAAFLDRLRIPGGGKGAITEASAGQVHLIAPFN